ncbi:amino acid ABC transporter permease [Microlunatus elymi]|uniref:Amino acid ABC transporter permease n=1 Tax=Microlunatus elymi TaxID=2596828 RepID=A0A516Q163_9ACTN|nr:amino acid ABC transporter permease [Microlunatus elymi]QDP97174.1 amino acid ABC transporter permease [Microlunatus elymi]
MSDQTTVLFDAPGPKARRRHLIIGVVAGLLFLLALFLIIRGLANPKNNQFTAAMWKPFLDASTWLDYLLPGLASTLLAAVIAIVLSIILGVLLGLGRLAQNRIVRGACGVIVEFFRAVPVLVGMLFSYYFALFVLHLPNRQAFFGVIVGLTLYNMAVIAELIRSGVHSLPGGQREAGLAIGLTESQSQWAILLPQAITAMLPSLVSQLVVILKDTALGAIIGYPDLLQSGYTMSNLYGNLIPTVIVVAAMYIIINYSLTRVARWLERRMARRGRSAGKPPQDTMIDNPAASANAAASTVGVGSL